RFSACQCLFKAVCTEGLQRDPGCSGHLPSVPGSALQFCRVSAVQHPHTHARLLGQAGQHQSIAAVVSGAREDEQATTARPALSKNVERNIGCAAHERKAGSSCSDDCRVDSADLCSRIEIRCLCHVSSVLFVQCPSAAC